jgi:hypothetical protein
MYLDMQHATIGEERSGRARILRVQPTRDTMGGFQVLELLVGNSGTAVTLGWLWGDRVGLADHLYEGQLVEVRAVVAAAWDSSPRDLDILEIRPLDTSGLHFVAEYPEPIFVELSRPLAFYILSLLWAAAHRDHSEWLASTLEEVAGFTMFLEQPLPPGAHGKQPDSARQRAAAA